jgi:hypothetical protein
MISRSLSRRLERLDTCIMPTSTTSNPVVVELQFVLPEKVVTSSMSIEHPRKARVDDEGYR